MSLIFISIVSTSFFRLAIIGLVIYGFIQYSKTKKHTKKINLHTVPPQAHTRRHIERRPYFNNRFWGSGNTGNEVYEWDDINIHCGFGDTDIDLGMTMLPQGESTVIIRGLFGNIRVFVPFDVDVIVNHSTMSGKIKVFDEERDLFNTNIIFQPEQDEAATRTIKIFTSTIIGNVEVKRI
nr:cell wall-active antibiotics response protein LiaF [Bacillus sp. FJAT-50079]